VTVTSVKTAETAPRQSSAAPRPVRSNAEIAALAAATCGTRYAGVTYATAAGPKLHAAHGFDGACPAPIADLCARTLRENDLLVVADPGELSLYAGVPIVAECGEVFGVLWVADDAARPPLAAHTEDLLVVLAEQIALRVHLRDIWSERVHALDMVSAVVFYATRDGVMTRISSSWTTLTGRSVEGTLGRSITELLQAGAGNPLDAVLAESRCGSVDQLDCTVTTADGGVIPVSLALTRFAREGTDDTGQVLGVVTDLRERQRRELEARHDQKLESLGRLSAGIAHEINTPIQFVGDNTRFLASAYEEMLDLLLVYRGCMDDSWGEVSWEQRMQRAATAEQEADIDYLTAEVPVAVKQSLEGIERVASLVRAMKSFSYKDSTDRSYADLNDALTTTLTVARNEVKYVADVSLDLGELPPVLCHVGDLNQVFLNLLVNAADALHEKGERGEIRITTHTEGQLAVISVADNGPGIPLDLQRMIFEPFFTTKEVGKGTGQGLALARAVVTDKHGGTIEVHSAPGQGTEFVLRLPVDGKRTGPA
jgi:two-component system NtrC family sensor kinase